MGEAAAWLLALVWLAGSAWTYVKLVSFPHVEVLRTEHSILVFVTFLALCAIAAFFWPVLLPTLIYLKRHEHDI
jgi:hypothetical protein